VRRTKLKKYWCNNCIGFVNYEKKYSGAIIGNIIISPVIIITALTGYPIGIPIKRICKRCGTKLFISLYPFFALMVFIGAGGW